MFIFYYIILIIVTICYSAIHGMHFSSNRALKNRELSTKINNKFVYDGTYACMIIWYCFREYRCAYVIL